ncbi:MAG: TldD/PmbA family protein [Christensenellales bacterium]|jgi:PmbA protein
MSWDAFRKELFKIALEEGCSFAETYYVQSESFRVEVLQRQTDQCSFSDTATLGLRVMLGGKSGIACTQAPRDAGELVLRAMDNARCIENKDEVPVQGQMDIPKVTPPENPLHSLSEQEKVALCHRLEQETLAADSRIEKVTHNVLTTSRSVRAIHNTLGLAAVEQRMGGMLFVEAAAKDGEEVQQGASFRFKGQALDAVGCAREAAEKAVARLGAKPVSAGNYRVLLDSEAAGDLLSAFSSMWSAEAAQKGLSLLAGKEGENIAGENITVIDDPLHPLNPRAFDDEGTPARTTVLIENGRLLTLMHNLSTAKKAGRATTGNAGRPSPASPLGVSPSNFYIAPGTDDFDALIQKLGDGLVIRGISGLHAGANAVSGQFSLLAHGQLVEGGRIVRPVDQITVAGSFLALLNNIEAVGSDLFMQPGGGGLIGSPSLLVKELVVSGR